MRSEVFLHPREAIEEKKMVEGNLRDGMGEVLLDLL